jgi:hypothetical protein
MASNPISGVTTNLVNDEWFVFNVTAANQSVDLPTHWTTADTFFEVLTVGGNGATYNYRIYNPASPATAPQLSPVLAVPATPGANAVSLVIGTKSSANHTIYWDKNTTSGITTISSTTGTVGTPTVLIRRVYTTRAIA